MKTKATPPIHAAVPELALPSIAESAWGMRELQGIDPHGNLLKFGEPL